MSGDDYEQQVTSGTLGAFGKYLMSRTYDAAMSYTDRVLHGAPASPSSQHLQKRLEPLTQPQKDAAEELAREAVIASRHGLLHGLSHDEDRIRVLFDGEDVAAASDGLHGDLFVWLRDLSAHPYA